MFKYLFIIALSISFHSASAEETKKEQTEPYKIKVTVNQEQKDSVSEMLKKFAKGIGKDISQYDLQIVESEDLNAFASLGNKIVVNTALINFLENEAALAFVMAHELGHLESHHVYKSIFRTGITGLFKALVFKKKTIYSNIYDGANQFHNLHYSRSKEREADHFAVSLMNKFYCKSPNKLEFFQKISSKEKTHKIMEYFSTHPLPENREEYLRDKVTDAGCVL